MKTRKEWNDFKKKAKIPDGAVEGAEFGPELEKCQKVVNDDKKPLASKLKAINEFRKTFTKYQKELPSALKSKAKVFLEEVEVEIASVETAAFEEAQRGKDGKGAVVNLDPGDEVIDPAAKSIAKDRKLGADKNLRRQGETDDETDEKSHGDVQLKKDVDFSKATNEPIVILAHGTPIGKHGSGKVRASEFAGKKPGEIIDFIAKTLAPTYYGIVYLDGCFTAAGNSPMNFGKLVYDGLVKKGYHYLQIKGNLGAAITVDGKEFVIPAELDKYYDGLKAEKKQLEADIKAMRKQYEDARIDLGDKLAAIMKGKKQTEITPEQKKIAERINVGIESTYKLQGENTKLNEAKARQKQVEDIIEKELKIEALTGTFGPERLPPKK